MSGRGRIAVIGGSIAGLFAGVLLRRAGWTVDIYERSSKALESRGAGIVIHDDLFAALASGGIALEGALGVPSRGALVVAAAFTHLGQSVVTHGDIRVLGVAVFETHRQGFLAQTFRCVEVPLAAREVAEVAQTQG